MSHIYLAVSRHLTEWAGDHLGATPLKIGWTTDVKLRQHTLNNGVTRNGRLMCAPCLGYEDWTIIWHSADLPCAKSAERTFKRFARTKFHQLVRKPKPIAGFPETNGESEIFFFEEGELIDAGYDIENEGLPVAISEAVTHLLASIQQFDDAEAYRWPEGYEIDEDEDDDDGDSDGQRDRDLMLRDLESDRREAIGAAASNAENGWPDDDGCYPEQDEPEPEAGADDDDDPRH